MLSAPSTGSPAVIARWFFTPAPPSRLGGTRVLVGGYTLYYLGKRWRLITKTSGGKRRDFRPIGVIRPLRQPLPLTAVKALTIANYAATAAFMAGWRQPRHRSGPRRADVVDHHLPQLLVDDLSYRQPRRATRTHPRRGTVGRRHVTRRPAPADLTRTELAIRMAPTTGQHHHRRDIRAGWRRQAERTARLAMGTRKLVAQPGGSGRNPQVRARRDATGAKPGRRPSRAVATRSRSQNAD